MSGRFIGTVGALNGSASAAAVRCLVLATLVGACSPPTPSRTCQPGESRACVGVTGCAGASVCIADGSAFGSCVCTAVLGGGAGGSGGGSAGGGAGGGGGAAVTDAGFDAGVPDAGSRCRVDFDCGAHQICNATTGACVTGPTCTSDFNCQSLDPQDRCYRYGQQCTCDTSAQGGGVCRLRKGPCEECTSDSQCGSDAIIFGPPDGAGAGRCLELPSDPSGKKYCRYQRVGSCACGRVNDGTDYCRPLSNTCGTPGCNVDRECPGGTVCSVKLPISSTCGGSCVPRCRWDFATRSLAAPGCPAGESCWVDSANLDPSAIAYGTGHCKPPCSSTTDCQASSTNPFGGTNLTCASELLATGTQSPRRCRANGACMDTLECPAPAPGQPNLGYCDPASFTCHADCRTGTEPSTGLPFPDCRPPSTCVVGTVSNTCLP